MHPPDLIIPLVAILSLFVAAPAIISNAILKFHREKNAARSTSADGLGLSELQKIIEDAVVRGNGPLLEQMDRLEDRLDRMDRRSEGMSVPDAAEWNPSVEPTREKTAGRTR